MAQLLQVKTIEKPSFFNDELLIGLFGAMLFGANLPVALLSGAIGGAIGYARIKQENTEGKQISAPSFWNRETFSYTLTGAAFGPLFGFIAGAIASSAILTFAPAETAVAQAANLVAFGLAAFATMLMGTIIGGKIGKKREELEYATAFAGTPETTNAIPVIKERRAPNSPMRGSKPSQIEQQEDLNKKKAVS